LGAFHAEPPFGAPWVYCSVNSSSDRHAKNPSNAAGGYSPVYYAAAIPYYLAAWPASVDIRLQAVRLWSVTLGVFAAVFTYLAASWAFAGDRKLSVATAVLFTLQPMISQQTALVNNDALLIAVAAAFWWRYFRALRVGLTIREAGVLGGLVGLAYLAKQQGLLLASALPFLYLYGTDLRRLRTELAGGLRMAAAAAMPVIGAVLVGAALSLLAGGSAGSPLAIDSTAGSHSIRDYIWLYTVPHFGHAYFLYVTSFWGFFGWFQVPLPNVAYVLIATAVLVGAFGLALMLVTKHPERRLVTTTLLSTVSCGVLLQALELFVYLRSGALILQGRSFLLLLTPALILLMWGWGRLLPRRATWALGPAAVLAAAILNLVSIFVMLDAFYG
jgi:hypothetical protein